MAKIDLDSLTIEEVAALRDNATDKLAEKVAAPMLAEFRWTIKRSSRRPRQLEGQPRYRHRMLFVAGQKQRLHLPQRGQLWIFKHLPSSLDRAHRHVMLIKQSSPMRRRFLLEFGLQQTALQLIAMTDTLHVTGKSRVFRPLRPIERRA